MLFDTLGLGVGDRSPEKGTKRSVGDLLLATHLSYLNSVSPLLDHPGLHGLAHITGGGLTDNLPRILPKKHRAEIKVGTWEIPELFYILQDSGGVDTDEMFRVFNMGIGMVLVVDPEALREVLGSLRASGQRGEVIGTVQKGGSGVVYDLPPPADA